MDIRDQIDAYLADQLTEADKLAFENELSSNPEIQQELNFQRDIVEGIKEARKADLKAMLNNVPVGSTGFELSGSTMQYIGAALITVLIGFGIFYFWPSDERQTENATTENAIPEVREDATEVEPVEVEETIPEEVIDETSEPVVEEQTPEKSQVEEVAVQKPEEEPVVEEEVVQEDVAKEPVSTESVRPTVIEGFDTEDGSEHDVPDDNLGRSTQSGTSMEVEINTSIKKYNFHYQIINSRLVLFGDFSEKYEIMDLMKDDQRALYLFYKDKYYRLSLRQSEVTALEEITDSTALKELEDIRINR